MWIATAALQPRNDSGVIASPLAGAAIHTAHGYLNLTIHRRTIILFKILRANQLKALGFIV